MMKKVTVAALFLMIAFLPLTGVAAGDPSYFEGTWVGKWEGFKGPSMTMDAALEIRKGNAEGVFLVEYSWEGGTSGSGFPPLPGSIKAKGKMEGEALVFEWATKKGTRNTMTLKKHEENNKLKARLDKSGPMGAKERPLNETTFRRK